MALTVPLLCIGVLCFMTFLLGLLVSLARREQHAAMKKGVATKDHADAIERSNRVHGNTVEYAPAMMLLMYYVHTNHGSSSLLFNVLCVVCTAARISIARGIALKKQPNVLRFYGAVGTYVGGVLLTLAVLADAASK